MKTQEEARNEIKELILSERDKGNVVFMGLDELLSCPVDEFIQQPVDGILYDLNRLPEVALTFIENPKWVNDFAVGMVIKKLYEKWQETEEKLRLAEVEIERLYQDMAGADL